METSYERVMLYRNTARTICISVVACPAAEETLTSALTIEATIQNIYKVYWQEQALVWKNELSNRCNLGRFAQPSDFPDFPYPVVDPSLGLNGNEEINVLFQPAADLQVRIEEKKLASAAMASRDAPLNWQVRWSE